MSRADDWRSEEDAIECTAMKFERAIRQALVEFARGLTIDERRALSALSEGRLTDTTVAHTLSSRSGNLIGADMLALFKLAARTFGRSA